MHGGTADRPEPPPFAGLCTTCVHARTIESSRGSRFLLCERSLEDASFPRYPRLPVITCRGYTPFREPGPSR